ncbi:MAG: hypothetical protein L0K65_02115, partial [Actinomyces sp.]|nr:hypothetical protein [Actinomyces sp.]
FVMWRISKMMRSLGSCTTCSPMNDLAAVPGAFARRQVDSARPRPMVRPNFTLCNRNAIFDFVP